MAVREANRFLELFNSPGSAVAWVTDFICPFSNKQSKVVSAIVSYQNTCTFSLPSSQLCHWATALPCDLHYLLFSRLFWINATLQCTDNFQSSLELFNCLLGFPLKLFLLWCKIEKKSFCQIWRELLLHIFLKPYFATKSLRDMHSVRIVFGACCFISHQTLPSADTFQHTKGSTKAVGNIRVGLV